VVTRNFKFWGKIRIGEDGQVAQELSLTQHSLDVASVFNALVDLPAVRRKLEVSAGTGLEEHQIQRLAVVALLHDIGKANLGFQDKVFDINAPSVGHVRELAPLLFEPELLERFIMALEFETICNWFDSPEDASAFLIAAWSHHGQPQSFDPAIRAGMAALAKWWKPDQQRDPLAAIAELLDAAKKAYPLAFENGGKAIPSRPRLQHRFAGLVMLSDWLGSHQAYFTLERPDTFPILQAREDARHAVKAVGLDVRAWQTALVDTPSAFTERFGFPPRSLQQVLDTLATAPDNNRLLIAEAETGSGKTEAALARFFRLFAAGEVDSLYFALPTRVAAKELYGRINSYVQRTFPDPDCRPFVVLAVPGYARVDNIPVERILPGDDTRWHDNPEDRREMSQTLRERLWAAEHPKRFLAAPIAVGTLDQALLSALQTPHAHLRSVCLDRSLLVVDEVHASDPYMRRLLHDLLDHHLGLGGHALLLSATLGSRARAAFTGHPEPGFDDAVNSPYPALTDKTGRQQRMHDDQPASSKPVTMEIHACLERPETLLPDITLSLQAGARVLVVLNTVGRAIALQRAAEADLDIAPVLFRVGNVIAPHHGRFAPVDREVLDAAVTDTLGKDSPSGARLLIGTQTLEQSLDIDADLLITDLCPMDVLLQRIGRLHRHRRKRPSGFESARCLLLTPSETDLEILLDAGGIAIQTAKRNGLGSVYPDLRVLQLTRDSFSVRPCIEIPQDNRKLVEGATHSERLASLTGSRWAKHGQEVEGSGLAQQIRAHYVSLADFYEEPFGKIKFRENEEFKTRLGLANLRVPLEREIPSPFGQPLTEIHIPAHLAPKATDEDKASVIGTDGGIILLAYGGNRYRYSRLGLEKLNA
jgi:CRISPR-associated endonuclease/helicase Cas3